MRTVAQRNKRKTFYRVISVVFIVIGAAKMTMALLAHGKAPGAEFPAQIESALMWFLFAGTWVALSRIWGELADSSKD